MELALAGVGALVLVVIICHAARNDDGTRSQWRNIGSQLFVLTAIVGAGAFIVWVGTYGN